MLKSLAMSKYRNLLQVLILLIFTVMAFWFGYAFDSLLESPAELGLVQEAYRLLDAHFIETLPENLILQRGMVKGMLETLNDPYTRLVEPSQNSIQSDTLAGEYGGIGALITSDGEGSYFINPFKDGPASAAGIVEGAQLLAIDGVPLGEGITRDTIVSMLRGLEGTEVRLRIRQPNGRQAIEVVIERVNIPLPSVSEYLLPADERIGVVAINVFSEKTSSEVENAVASLLDRGAQGLILDLRNNGGGLLESAVEVSRLFLRTGIIVSEERRGILQEAFEVEKPGRYTEIPLAVVVDSTSASAAEVVAAALQGNDRAPLIGDRTFGKGSVQVVVELSDGSSMRITSSRWLTPEGEIIDEQGLAPDLWLGVEDAHTERALLQAADWLAAELENG
ncbi:MAG: S41 family peptidase [Anaerolineales bacterium]